MRPERVPPKPRPASRIIKPIGEKFSNSKTLTAFASCVNCVGDSKRTVSEKDAERGEIMPRQRRTGAKAAKAASKVLGDGRTSKASKTAAASALSQRAPRRKKR